MAKGDIRSRRGKVANGSHGRRRPSDQRQAERYKQRGYLPPPVFCRACAEPRSGLGTGLSLERQLRASNDAS
ncbi:30S ribosomal protein THX [Halomonas zincidurans]|uniref:30S ribosomal protein THX n=1 Tax=Modicisalibacter zincidurans TaxID=1178777 RepID=UPI0004DB6C68